MALLPELIPGVTGFNWDEGNSAKTRERHGVTPAEAEQVFFNRPLVVGEASKQPAQETRQFVLGRTDHGRALAVVFTLRGSLLRVISARPMSRKERRIYAQSQEA
jgi:uncharacterized DUF497 family protein